MFHDKLADGEKVSHLYVDSLRVCACFLGFYISILGVPAFCKKNIK